MCICVECVCAVYLAESKIFVLGCLISYKYKYVLHIICLNGGRGKEEDFRNNVTFLNSKICFFLLQNEVIQEEVFKIITCAWCMSIWWCFVCESTTVFIFKFKNKLPHLLYVYIFKC